MRTDSVHPMPLGLAFTDPQARSCHVGDGPGHDYTVITALDWALGDYTFGRFAWLTRNLRPLVAHLAAFPSAPPGPPAAVQPEPKAADPVEGGAGGLPQAGGAAGAD